MIIVLIIFIFLLVVLPIICYEFYFVKKWYKKGYDSTMELHKENKLGKVVNPHDVSHTCNENKFWHYGAYDAYCEIIGTKNKSKNF